MAGMGVAVAAPAGASTVLAPSADAATVTAAPAAAPAAAPTTTAVRAATTAAPADVVWLTYGSTGDLVKTMQTRIGGLAADGSFGPATLARVKAFQASHRLYVDGKVGPATWQALGGFPSTNTQPCQVPTLRYGSSGSLVRTAQQQLGRLTVDGNFGPATLARVKNFQAGKGLPATGVVDSATWRALGGACVGVGGTGGTGGTTGGTTTGGTTTGGTTPTQPAVGDPNAPYRMPFAKGSTYRITQGPNGVYSHHTAYNRYGIDFGMPIGTSVVASRSGTVVDTGWTNAGGGKYVLIKDASGLCQVYFHLSGYQVAAGQPVAQGQRIATSGNTGNSSGPHLHFGLLNCNTWLSAALPNSVERGTSYVSGVSVTSTNG